MGTIANALSSLQEDFNAADKVVDDIYNNYFAKYFQREVEMQEKFRDINVSITDKELEWIITSLPLDLFAASDALSQFKQHNEIVKLTIKQRKSKGVESQEIDEEYKLMQIVYTSVIDKVEHQISFSKELIMGAKKVWDARKRSEQPPINEVNIPELPEYKPIVKQTGVYVKGVDNV